MFFNINGHLISIERELQETNKYWDMRFKFIIDNIGKDFKLDDLITYSFIFSNIKLYGVVYPSDIMKNIYEITGEKIIPEINYSEDLTKKANNIYKANPKYQGNITNIPNHLFDEIINDAIIDLEDTNTLIFTDTKYLINKYKELENIEILRAKNGTEQLENIQKIDQIIICLALYNVNSLETFISILLQKLNPTAK